MTRVSPSSDPEVQRERKRQRDRARYARNRVQLVEQQREWRQRNPQRSREINKGSADRNREKVRAYNRAYMAENGDEVRARRRAAWAADPGKYRAYGHRARHGRWIAEDRAATWEAQGGCCYLCADPLVLGKEHIDHDHRCCPDDHSCRTCRRGLACGHCNVAIGMGADDPARLRRMAGNLEAAQRAVEQRMRTTPYQPELLTGS